MTKKTNYQAVFGNGRITTRSSARMYSHAWNLTKDGKNYDHGFSGSKELAEKSAKREMNFLISCQPENSKVQFSFEVVEATAA